MYDMDVPAINGKLNDCRAYKLLSNPAIELWFLDTVSKSVSELR